MKIIFNPKVILIVLFALIFFSCTTTKFIVYYDLPIELKDKELLEKFINDYSIYVKGKTIFLDPGHGGEDRHNKGPKGVIEADVNLKVALYLRNYFQKAGAVILMSRDKDTSVNLKDRSIIANKSNADFFISIHHNAPGKKEDDWTNYSSTYYHAKETDYEYEPMERDMARYVQRDLSYAMRNSGGLGSFDGTYSDYFIYPGMGFSVLRITELPSILVECSFFTHKYEEDRLAIDEFNKIQAWGIFRGFCRYLKNGIPKISFNKKNTENGKLNFYFKIDDSTGVEKESIKVFYDSLNTNNFKFDTKSSILIFSVQEKIIGEHIIKIIAANKNGNHSFPFTHKFNID